MNQDVKERELETHRHRPELQPVGPLISHATEGFRIPPAGFRASEIRERRAIESFNVRSSPESGTAATYAACVCLGMLSNESSGQNRKVSPFLPISVVGPSFLPLEFRISASMMMIDETLANRKH